MNDTVGVLTKTINREVDRNYGIDLLRIVAMYMIVILHVLGKGGILENTVSMSYQWMTGWLLEVMSYGAVNCYAMISGYVGYNKPVCFHQLIGLWFQVFFYTLGITIVFKLFVPGCYVSLQTWIDSLLPFVRGHYWYITAFFGMFFFRPLINTCIRSMSKAKFKIFFASVFIAYIVFPSLLHADTLKWHSGCSTFWLLFLYIIGGGVAKFNGICNDKRINVMTGYWIMTILAWLSVLTIVFLNKTITGSIRGTNFFVSYTSPFIFVASVCLVVYFASGKFSNTILKKMISWLSPATLGVYLIHEHILVRNNLMKGYFSSYASDNPLMMLMEVFGFALSIYMVCSLIDMARKRLFRYLKIDSVTDTLARKVQEMIGWDEQ